MTALADLELPSFDYLDPELRGERFHAAMRELAGRGWLATMPLGCVAVDREAGDFFLRSRSFTFPGMKIAEIFGIDDGPLYEEIRRNILHLDGDHHRRLRGLVNPAFTPRAVERWRPHMRGFLAELHARAAGTGRADAVDDLISTLIAAEAEGDRLSDVELLNLVLNVLVGGVDTTQSQLAHAIRLFAEHPDQWRLLAENPLLAAQAVEEVVRFEPITPFTARIAMEDVVYRDVTFPEDTVVLVCAFTGNRDGAPDEFDITADRTGAKPLTFGAGIHYCLGANLARAEMQEALVFLSQRMPGLELAGEPEYGALRRISRPRSPPAPS